jgi:hypothetical protein
MDERSFNHEIRHAWSTLDGKLGIGRALVWDRSLRVDDIFRAVALDEESSYENIFKAGLNRSSYNILLTDYAYFQFGWQNDTSWRLAYFPNPFVTGVSKATALQKDWEAAEELGVLSHERVSDLLADMPYAGAVPPLRFDFAPSQYRELIHPAAHFHIGRFSKNRWPSAVAIGPEAFSLIVAKLYYPDSWTMCSKLEGSAVDECIEEAFLAVVNNVRLVHDFSDRERRSFHFGKNFVVAPAAVRDFET